MNLAEKILELEEKLAEVERMIDPRRMWRSTLRRISVLEAKVQQEGLAEEFVRDVRASRERNGCWPWEIQDDPRFIRQMRELRKEKERKDA